MSAVPSGRSSAVARGVFRALAAVFALSALARVAIAALLFARAGEPIELYFAAAIALIVWSVWDAFVAWALVRAELTGRMLGFVSASLSAVAGWGVLELCGDRRSIAVIALSVAIATALSVTPSRDSRSE
ncbi:MAG: hypothetical protein U0269_07930 [Polyangiales bacterium]